ncbi:MAG: endonuclease/exonuclease/phosphatase family protein [Lysobacterales bacterium]
MLVVGLGGATGAISEAAAALGQPEEVQPPPPEVLSNDRDSVGSINGDEIRVLVWNVQKGSSDQWIDDFRAMAVDSDLVLLQEAQLHPGFAAGLSDMLRWDMVKAWQLAGVPTGVMTASNATPLSVRALEKREPLLRTDKSALLTEYRLAGSELTLLVANVHAINFTADTGAFRLQLTAIAELVNEHEGPVIFSGDFNTWRQARRVIVNQITKSLGLREVRFRGPRKQFGSYVLDRMYYRGLDLLTSRVPSLDSSDHNPLRVVFRNPRRADRRDWRNPCSINPDQSHANSILGKGDDPAALLSSPARALRSTVLRLHAGGRSTPCVSAAIGRDRRTGGAEPGGYAASAGQACTYRCPPARLVASA